MKFQVKRNGVLTEATAEDLLNPSVQLYDAEGKEYTRPAAVVPKAETPPAPAPVAKEVGANVNAGVDPVAELVGVVRDMAGNSTKVLDRVAALEAQLDAYKEWNKRTGFMPFPNEPGATLSEEEARGIFAPYDLAKQGRELMNKFHGKKVITEQSREEIAKYMVLFLKAGVHQSPVAMREFHRLYGSTIRGYEKATSTDLGDSGNVFPVPEPVQAEILAFAREESVVLKYARIWEMTSEKQKFPAETSRPAVSWGNTTLESNPQVGEVELSVEELSAYTAIRNTTLADANSDLVTWITEMMAESVGQELDNEAFNGDGTNLLSGLLSSSVGNTVTMGAEQDAFANMTDIHLSEMIAKLSGKRKMGARFFWHGEIFHLVRTLKDSQERPIFVDTVGSALPPTVWNYPFDEVPAMPSTSAANTAFVSFGNLRYLAVGRRLQSMALEANRWAKDAWTTNRTWFKVYQRWAMQLALANAFVRLRTGSGS